MADITKCSNEECKMKDKCLRYLAKGNEYWQSYCHFECSKENNWEYMIRVNKIEADRVYTENSNKPHGTA